MPYHALCFLTISPSWSLGSYFLLDNKTKFLALIDSDVNNFIPVRVFAFFFLFVRP